ncbi:hypothetical protein, partial [Bradyrhizobium sp. SBR1B]|uniref:hypothetical protein n=1 Tax=Bradyrhizobium sp. SBR1B TaxID=2663836 RepID=UPI0018529E8C
RPLGISQNESVHSKLESQSSGNENPESKQTLVSDEFELATIAEPIPSPQAPVQGTLNHLRAEALAHLRSPSFASLTDWIDTGFG